MSLSKCPGKKRSKNNEHKLGLSKQGDVKSWAEKNQINNELKADYDRIMKLFLTYKHKI